MKTHLLLLGALLCPAMAAQTSKTTPAEKQTPPPAKPAPQPAEKSPPAKPAPPPHLFM